VDAVGLVSGRASVDFDSWGLSVANATVGEPRMFGIDVTKTF
jgi:hypothetical protein